MAPEIEAAISSPSGSSHPVRKALAAHLIAAGRLTPAGAQRAERLSEDSGERFEVVLARLGLSSEPDIAEAGDHKSGGLGQCRGRALLDPIG